MKFAEFLCPQCNYQARVSAGEDFGYRSNSLTMICRACASLVEVIIQAGYPEQDRMLRRCPRCASAKVSPWNPLTMPCPKCGTTMQEVSRTTAHSA